MAHAVQETAEEIQQEDGTSAVEIAGVIPSSEISTLSAAGLYILYMFMYMYMYMCMLVTVQNG